LHTEAASLTIDLHRRLVADNMTETVTVSASGTNFRDVAPAVDCFVNTVNRLVVDTPLSVRNVEGLCKDRRVC
jgi:hypothetical protein